MDGDKALEKTAIITLWKKVLQTAQIFIKIFLFYFIKIQTRQHSFLHLDPGPTTV